jgi:hypothetical protein
MNKKQVLKKALLCSLLMLFCCTAMAQNISVSGKITDEKGQSLPGATIMVKGTTRGISTDLNGNFTIAAGKADVLVISVIGYSKLEEPVNGRSVINVQLSLDSRVLNEIVVIGYGTQKRKDVTGSIASIKGDIFKDQPITNPTEALQGRIAGVDIVKNSGAPDATPTIIIRGLASLHQPVPSYA